jgi:hypothetical protein
MIRKFLVSSMQANLNMKQILTEHNGEKKRKFGMSNLLIPYEQQMLGVKRASQHEADSY